jgi:hypothetical protein
MSPAGFETKIPASERPQTHALDCATAVNGNTQDCMFKISGKEREMQTARIEFVGWFDKH